MINIANANVEYEDSSAGGMRIRSDEVFRRAGALFGSTIRVTDVIFYAETEPDDDLGQIAVVAEPCEDPTTALRADG